METQGLIDFYGFHPGAAGWFFCGWLPLNDKNSREIEVRNVEFSAVFESGRAAMKALLVLFDRADLGDRGTGFVIFVNHFHRSQGRVGLAELRVETHLYRLEAADTITQLRDMELVGRLKAILPGVFAGHRTEMTAMLERRGFTGADTVHRLTEPIRMGLDEAIVCRPDGIVLLGWCIDVHNAIASLSLSVGGTMMAVDQEVFVPVDRQDVIDTVGRELGFSNLRCEFITFIPAPVSHNDLIYLQVETRSGEVGYLQVPARRLSGMAAIAAHP